MTSFRSKLLDDARQLVNGARNDAYGSPSANQKAIADLWRAYLSGVDVLRDSDVAVLNILQKIARLQHSPDHEDSWVDTAGYAAVGFEVSQEKGGLTEARPPTDTDEVIGNSEVSQTGYECKCRDCEIRRAMKDGR